MDETQDQVQEDSQATDQAEEQSDTTSEEELETSKPYKTPDGREMTADEIYAEYNKLLPEFTKRSQKLSEYEKTTLEREERAKTQAQEALDNSDLLENVDPNVKLAIGEIAKEVLAKEFESRELKEIRLAEDRALNDQFEKSAELHNGKDGLPKFNEDIVLAYMVNNKIGNTEIAYREMNRGAIEDKLIKDALKNKGGSIDTESTGGSSPRKPEGRKPAATLEEAAERAYQRVNS